MQKAKQRTTNPIAIAAARPGRILSPNVILSSFTKCGDLSHLAKDFHGLSPEDRRAVVEDIANGFDPAATIEVYKDDRK